MFLSSFEEWRKKLLKTYDIDTLVDFGSELFEGKVGHNLIVSWVTRNTKLNINGSYIRLVDYCYSRREEKKREYFNNDNLYISSSSNYIKIPGSPIAYWVNDKFLESFNNKQLNSYGEIITGMTIGDNNQFLRLWYEVNNKRIALNKTSMDEIDLKTTKWIPYSKGGQRRNWYGNYDYVVNWSKSNKFNRPKTTMKHLYLKRAISWPFITSGSFSARRLPAGSLWNVAGSPCFFEKISIENTVLCFLCSKVANYILNIINPMNITEWQGHSIR